VVDKYDNTRSSKYEVRVRELSWEGAKCIGENVDNFVSDEKGHRKKLVEFAAKQFCKTCPLITPCREFAVAHNTKGVWGGMNEEERKNFRDVRIMLMSLHT
jgi:WhiB family redox-sensing transcriptional regulator